MDSYSERESKLISLISQLASLVDPTDSDSKTASAFISLITEIISLVSSMEMDSQPKQEPSELMSLVTQTVSLFNSMDFDAQPKPLSELISLISEKVSIISSRNVDSHSLPTESEIMSMDLDSQMGDSLSKIISLSNQLFSVMDEIQLYTEPKFMLLIGQTWSITPEPELVSLIYRIFSIVISMDSKWEKLISLCPRVIVNFEEGKFRVNEEVRLSNNKWYCLPVRWKIFRLLSGEEATHFRCQSCNGDDHREYEKAPVEIKHHLHPKHPLQLVLLDKATRTRECYCCDEDLQGIFYYCSSCDYAMNIICVDKPPVLSIHYPKWHEHTLALFPRKASLTCDLCAIADSSCPFYICPPCDFVVHQSCISLPRVIRISRHRHRISFTPSFDQGDWSCGVCRRKINNDYGGYSCFKDNCLYMAHSKCATQTNVWDGIELEGESEETEDEEVEPFVTISDGVIQHISHQQHHLRLDEDTNRDYDENNLCQACIMPIYFGNFYSCMECDFILHETCANFPCKIHHPIHPHLLTLVGEHDFILDEVLAPQNMCAACPWLCTAGFFYECSKEGCCFKLHVKCATISEPLLHESHMHPLFLTSKPGEKRICSVCEKLGRYCTKETFNCIECDFCLCFKCATLPQKVRYKHDKHMLSLSYGEERNIITSWCEVCEGKIKSKERFYMCDEDCCVTLHIDCFIGKDFYMKPASSWIYFQKKVGVLPNNICMSRPICSRCRKLCPYKIVFQCSGSIFCSTICILGMQLP